ncbi:hypothetical protein B7463_g6748, partial [Scytalidium lignicola]
MIGRCLWRLGDLEQGGGRKAGSSARIQAPLELLELLGSPPCKEPSRPTLFPASSRMARIDLPDSLWSSGGKWQDDATHGPGQRLSMATDCCLHADELRLGMELPHLAADILQGWCKASPLGRLPSTRSRSTAQYKYKYKYKSKSKARARDVFSD